MKPAEKANVSVGVTVEVTDDDEKKPKPEPTEDLGDKRPDNAPLLTKPGVDETEQSFRFRVRDPGDFVDGSFRTGPFKTSTPRINAVFGRLKSEDKTALQSLIFPKNEGWTREKVQAWVDAHRDELKAWGVEAAQRFEEEAEYVRADAEPDPELATLHILQAKAPVPGRVVRKSFATAVKTVHEDTFSADIVISSADMDRDHEVVEPDGMVVKDATIPLVAGHFLGNLQNQIGHISKKPRRDGDILVTAPTWLVGRGNPQADWAWVLVQEGIAKFSIGFIPIEYEDADLSDEKVVARVRAGKMPVRRHTKWELVEVSQVIVPSNRSAVQRMADAGILVGEFADAAQKAAQDGEISAAAQTLFDRAIATWKTVRTAKLVIPSKSGTDDLLALFQEAAMTKAQHGCPDGYHMEGGKCVPDKGKDTELPITDLTDDLGLDPHQVDDEGQKQEHRWTVGGARGLPLLDDDAWDANAAVAAWRRATGSEEKPSARYKRGFVVYDAANPEGFGSYKLPFVKVVDGRAQASRRGLVAARVVLAGGRGGVDIGNARAGAIAFVNSYLGREEEEDAAQPDVTKEQVQGMVADAVAAAIAALDVEATARKVVDEALAGLKADVEARFLLKADITPIISAAARKTDEAVRVLIARERGDVDQYRLDATK